MALAVDIRLIGDKELARQLSKMEPRVQKKVVRQALRKAAKPIQRAIKDRVPGSGEKHDKLVKGIKIKSIKRSRSKIGVRAVLPGREELGIPASDPYYWPAALEYGHGNVPPYSYVRAGYDAKEQEAFAIAQREIGRGVEREAKKA